jgi:Nitronate monooxygenase
MPDHAVASSERTDDGSTRERAAMTATISTALTERSNCRYPIISAGMGGPARSELAAAVSEAGGFGLLGMVRESPELIAREIAEVRRRTSGPFGVNLIPFATEPRLLQEELAVCLNLRVPAICFFWDVYPEIVAQAKSAGCLVLHQVGSLEDALRAEAAGADVVILQGVEAGSHVRACRWRSCCRRLWGSYAFRSQLRAESPTGAASSPRSRSGPTGCSAEPRFSRAANPSPTTITSSGSSRQTLERRCIPISSRSIGRPTRRSGCCATA